jgi:hypothetical protein
MDAGFESWFAGMDSVFAESRFPPQVFLGVLTALSVPLLLIAIPRCMPSIRATYPTDWKEHAATLQKKYQFTQVWATVAWLSFMAVIAIVIAWGLLTAANYSLRPEADDIVFGRMPDSSLIILAIMISFLLAVPPTLLVLRMVLGQTNYMEFVELGNLQTGYKVPRVLPFLVLATVLGGIIASFLAIDCSFRLKPNRFEVNRFLTIGTRVCTIKSVRRLVLVRSYKAPIGAIVRDSPIMRIEMADGYTYSSRFTLISFYESRDFRSLPMFEAIQAARKRDFEAMQRVLDTISEATGVPLEIDDPFPMED